MASESGKRPAVKTRLVQRVERSETRSSQKKHTHPQIIRAVPDAEMMVRRSRKSPCPMATGSYLWSLPTSRGFEIGCQSWRCSYCGRKKRAAARLVLVDGLRGAFERGEWVRLVTYTDPTSGAGDLTVSDFYERWNHLRTTMRRHKLLNEYAAALEVQERGALHLHVLQTGAYIDKGDLHIYSHAHGLGNADIRAVQASNDETDERSAGYCAKEMAGYLSAKQAQALREKTNKRLRPLRTSGEWGMSLREAEKQINAEWSKNKEDKDDLSEAAPWLWVKDWGDGTITVRETGTAAAEPIPPPPWEVPSKAEGARPQAVATEADAKGLQQGAGRKAA